MPQVVFTSVGAPDITEAQFGLAATSLLALSKPWSWMVMIIGFGVVGDVAHRRRNLGSQAG